MITPHLTKRYQLPTLRRDIKCGIAAILGKEIQKDTFERVRLPSRQRCALCTRKEDKKTYEACCVCELPICDKHRLHVCHSCAD